MNDQIPESAKPLHLVYDIYMKWPKKSKIPKFVQQGYDARDKAWSMVGTLEEDVLAPIINPAFSGLPMWPNLRQSYKIVHLNDGNDVIATDGLSDPFTSTHPMLSDKSGFMLELYMVTEDKLEVETAAKSWQMSVLFQASLQVAHHGQFRELLDEHTYISLELYDTAVPKEYQKEDRVGVLLGLESDTIPESVELPRGDVKLVSVVVLDPKQTEEAAKNPEARMKLAKKLKSKSNEPVSVLK